MAPTPKPLQAKSPNLLVPVELLPLQPLGTGQSQASELSIQTRGAAVPAAPAAQAAPVVCTRLQLQSLGCWPLENLALCLRLSSLGSRLCCLALACSLARRLGATVALLVLTDLLPRSRFLLSGLKHSQVLCFELLKRLQWLGAFGNQTVLYRQRSCLCTRGPFANRTGLQRQRSLRLLARSLCSSLAAAGRCRLLCEELHTRLCLALDVAGSLQEGHEAAHELGLGVQCRQGLCGSCRQDDVDFGLQGVLAAKSLCRSFVFGVKGFVPC